MAGVLLTKRDTFLARADFMQLVYAACSPARPGLTDQADIACPPPAVLKPRPLWTGKQVPIRLFSALLLSMQATVGPARLACLSINVRGLTLVSCSMPQYHRSLKSIHGTCYRT